MNAEELRKLSADGVDSQFKLLVFNIDKELKEKAKDGFRDALIVVQYLPYEVTKKIITHYKNLGFDVELEALKTLKFKW